MEPSGEATIGVHASIMELSMHRFSSHVRRNRRHVCSKAEAYQKLKAFCTIIIQRLAPPLIREVQATQLRPEAEPFTPRRTTRAAKRLAHHTSKVSPAENVLLGALGIAAEDLQVDDERVHELRGMFDSPLREQHVRVFTAIFGKTMPCRAELERADTTVVLIR